MENNIEGIVEEFAQDFAEFVKRGNKVNAKPLASYASYVREPSFQKLSSRYDGKGPFYLGCVINKLLNDKVIKFTDGCYSLEKDVF